MSALGGEGPGRPPDLESPGVRELLGKLQLDWTPLRDSKPFRRLWFAQSASFIGSEVGYVALSYQVYALTNSTLAVGLLALAELIPMLTMTLVGGAFADAFDRRKLMLIQQCGMIVGAAIAVANAASSDPQAWVCFLSAFVTVSAFAFGAGAQHSLFPRLVADEQLVAANNLNGLSSSLGAVAGPALAGVLIATTGVTTAYVIDTVTFFGTLVAVWLLPSLKPEGGTSSPSLGSIVDGFRFVVQQKVDPRLHARRHERDDLRHADGAVSRARDAPLPQSGARRLPVLRDVRRCAHRVRARRLGESRAPAGARRHHRRGAVGRRDRRVRLREPALARADPACDRRRRRSCQRRAARRRCCSS